MSVDYLSFGVVLPAAAAARLADRWASDQWCGPIVGPEEETLVEAWQGTNEIDLADLARRYAGDLPSREHWQGASIDLAEADLELLGEELVMTNRSSALAGLDRVLAVPSGVDLLRGHALAHIPAARLDRFGLTLARLVKEFGGRARAQRILDGYLYGNSNDDSAEELLTMLSRVLARAKAEGADLIVASAIPP